MRLNDNSKENIKKMYNDGYSYREIMYQTGVSLATISGFVKSCIYKGELESKDKGATSKHKDGILRNDDGTVCCNDMTNRHCIYGASCGEKMCHYYLVKGLFHRRGCPPERCDKFVEGTPIDKKERGKFVFNEKGKGFQ